MLQFNVRRCFYPRHKKCAFCRSETQKLCILQVDLGVYKKSGHIDRVARASVLASVLLVPRTKNRRDLYLLSDNQRKKINRLFQRREAETGSRGKKARPDQTNSIGKTKRAGPAGKTSGPKPKKVKVDKTNPNWRLKPNPAITVWEKVWHLFTLFSILILFLCNSYKKLKLE